MGRKNGRAASAGSRDAQQWKSGQKFVFLAKGSGVLLVPVPEQASLRGLAKGADPEGYRDRKDRF